MAKSEHFKGKIACSENMSLERKTLMTYDATPLDAGLDAEIMSSFEFLNLKAEEKKHLSRRHRHVLNNYRHLNLFSLNADAQKLIEVISKSKGHTLSISACEYGAYICLAALYSGKLPKDKHIEFILEKSPLALFPTRFLKNPPKDASKKIIFNITDDCWLKPFTTLYSHNKIKCCYRKAA